MRFEISQKKKFTDFFSLLLEKKYIGDFTVSLKVSPLRQGTEQLLNKIKKIVESAFYKFLLVLLFLKNDESGFLTSEK